MVEKLPDAQKEKAAEEPEQQKNGSFIVPTKTFAALQFPNYRLWFIGQLASLVGTWMQSTAQGYLVYQLTGSPLYLGYVGFAAGIPTWIFSLFGGVVSDRMHRRKLLIITQSVSMTLAFILAALTFTGTVRPWHIIVLAFLLGVNNAFDAPARQSFVLELVSREVLGNAIALNSAMFNSATAVGPAVAGLAYAAFGPGWCFLINGVSFIAVIIALSLMHFKPFVAPPRTKNPFSDMREGLGYVFHNKTILVLIGMLAITSVFGMSFTTLIPAWAVDVLNGNSATNGWLQSARGIGSLVAALMIASQISSIKRGKMLTIGSFLFPTLLIIFSFIRSLPISLITLMFVGWSYITYVNMTNNLVQHIVPDNLRGRVMSIYTLVLLGMSPIGSMLAGSLAEAVGTPSAVLVCASIQLFFAVVLFIGVPSIRKLR
ncbi:MAG: MFS transporter [Chloroflexi bacterium]|nr:MFS transporter [Chloroflexota bacterium]